VLLTTYGDLAPKSPNKNTGSATRRHNFLIEAKDERATFPIPDGADARGKI
jgi:hypothetical protein